MGAAKAILVSDPVLAGSDALGTAKVLAAVPFAETMPPIESYLVCTPSPTNPLGVKGMGESGTIGVTPALVNAVMNALRPYGVRHLDMPLTPEKIWTAINGPR